MDDTASPSDADDRQVFDFEFEARYKPLLRLLGIAPSSSRVVVGDGRLRCHFGPWTLDTPLDNVACATETGPYRAHRAIGARGSFADGGVTFGSTTRGGLCVSFHEPVPALLPIDAAKHPAVTLTVADPGALLAELEQRCDLGG